MLMSAGTTHTQSLVTLAEVVAICLYQIDLVWDAANRPVFHRL